MATKIKEVTAESIVFEDGSTLYSNHDSDCCETHYLGLSDIIGSDFEGLEFDLSTDGFFVRVPEYGIRLIPVSGHPISIPGYGYNNGYYSSNLDLILTRIKEEGTEVRTYDITSCQVIQD